MEILLTILSVLVISLMSLVGILFLLVNRKFLDKIIMFLVSLSAGSLFGGVFLHILPEVVEKNGFTIPISLSILAGILTFFIIEKIICWRHCHIPTSNSHPHHLAPINLIGDAVHNFIDGLIIAAGYMVDVNVGLATTIAVLSHEIPQEIGDFGVLIHAGMSKGKALLFNFMSALTSVLGAIVGLLLGAASTSFAVIILPFAAGGFLYIAGSDLIPELHKEYGMGKAMVHLFALVLGIMLMLVVRLVFG